MIFLPSKNEALARHTNWKVLGRPNARRVHVNPFLISFTMDERIL